MPLYSRLKWTMPDGSTMAGEWREQQRRFHPELEDKLLEDGDWAIEYAEVEEPPPSRRDPSTNP
jgi:hypothetical protein